MTSLASFNSLVERSSPTPAIFHLRTLEEKIEVSSELVNSSKDSEHPSNLLRAQLSTTDILVLKTLVARPQEKERGPGSCGVADLLPDLHEHGISLGQAFQVLGHLVELQLVEHDGLGNLDVTRSGRGVADCI